MALSYQITCEWWAEGSSDPTWDAYPILYGSIAEATAEVAKLGLAFMFPEHHAEGIFHIRRTGAVQGRMRLHRTAISSGGRMSITAIYAARRYIASLRNPAKRAYAEQYWGWLARCAVNSDRAPEPEHRSNLRAMGAQAVRLQLNEFARARWGAETMKGTLE